MQVHINAISKRGLKKRLFVCACVQTYSKGGEGGSPAPGDKPDRHYLIGALNYHY